MLITPAMAAPGSAITLSGKIGPLIAHAVELQMRNAGQFVTLQTGQTSETGRYTFAATVPDDRVRAVYRVFSPEVVDPTTGEVVSFVSRLADVTVTRSTTTRLTSDGGEEPVISADGRFVAYSSYSLSTGLADVYLTDRNAVVTTRITAAAPGVSYGYPAMSADGQFIAYSSWSEVGDHAVGDVWVWDRTTGSSTNITAAGGYSSRGGIYHGGASVSADGRFVAYASNVAAFATDDVVQNQDIFLWDRWSGTTTRVTPGTRGVYSYDPVVSADGSSVAFVWNVNDAESIRLWSRETGALSDVCVKYTCEDPAISADGRFVGFDATDDPNVGAGWDVFLWDRTTGTTQRVTRGSDVSAAGSISADGRYVAFESRATDLVARDRNYKWDVFVWDRLGRTKRITNGSQDSRHPTVSADGRHIVYTSCAENLVSAEPDDYVNVYLWDRPVKR